jgi:hypothetical protein
MLRAAGLLGRSMVRCARARPTIGAGIFEWERKRMMSRLQRKAAALSDLLQRCRGQHHEVAPGQRNVRITTFDE